MLVYIFWLNEIKKHRMKKILFGAIFLAASIGIKAQYSTINAILDRLEEKRGIAQDLKNVSLEDKKFIFIKEFDDHTERNVLSIKGNSATYIEMFDDKKTGETSSNVFTGDVVRTRMNMLSFRFDKLEGQKIVMPITKTMMLTMQKKIIYLIDANNKDRWIDESALTRK